MGLYLYCITDEPPADLSATEGLQSAQLHAVGYEGLYVIVSETDDSKPIVTKENARVHETVLRTILSETTPLPFRFGTLLSPRGLNDFMKAHREALESSLARISGCVEMGFEARRRELGSEMDSKGAHEEGPRAEARRRRQTAADASPAQIERFAHQLAHQLKGLVEDSKVEANPSVGVLLSAAHLLRRNNVGDYKRRLTEMYKPDIEVHVTGPWPPYSFSDI